VKRDLLIATVLGIVITVVPVGLSAGDLRPTTEKVCRQEIEKVLEDQTAAWNRGDIEAFMDGYWNSDELIFTSGGRVQRGWQNTLERYRKAYPDRPRMGVLTFSDLEIHFFPVWPGSDRGPREAWVLGKWELKRAVDAPRGVFTLILQKFPDRSGGVKGGWKIVHDHTSSLPGEMK